MLLRGIAATTVMLWAHAGLAPYAVADVPPPHEVIEVRERTPVPLVRINPKETWFRDAWAVRVNGGWATEKTLGEITAGGTRVEDERPSLIGLDVGRPLVDYLNDWPLHIGWRAGLQRFFERGNQSDFWAHTLYLKAYWTGFPWSHLVRTRLGFGEGISYAWHVPTEERDEARRHDRNTSRLLNYLDVSAELNVGDLSRQKPLERCWLGFVISHRSGAFGLVDIFGSVNGGSNYNTASLECEF